MQYDSPAAVKLRRIGQRLGVLRPVVRAYRKLTGASYEAAFDNALLGDIRAGDIVWDIGANQGFYTVKAAEMVGPTGKVVAFEPSRVSLPKLRAATSHLPQVEIAEVALSNEAGEAQFFDTDDAYTSSMAAKGTGGYSVQVKRGDEYRANAAPNIIKIDVEGFEPEVIDGLSETLASPSLRGVFVEVHFLELSKRGRSDAPRAMCALMERRGLRVNWIDPSHFAARRMNT
jgi:FkbM family methyltransferase